MLAEKVIRKHVSLIHAYSLMSSLQRKIFNVLLYEANSKFNNKIENDSVSVESRISFSQLTKAVNFNSRNTKYLKESIDGLASLKIEWNLLKDKVPTDISFINLRVLHGSPTFYHDGTFNFSLHKIMLCLTTNPSVYGTVDLDLQSQFESKYGHSLYENSTRFVNLNKSKVIHLDTFRKLMGVDDSNYSSLRELTRNVVAPSIEEVNDRCDFIVKLDAIKSGRKVTGFELVVNPKKNKSLSNDVIDFEKLKKEIKAIFGVINSTVLENIISTHPKEYIEEKIAYTKKYAKQNKDSFYPIPYFISALKYDYKENANENKGKINNNKNTHVENNDWRHEEDSLLLDVTHWNRILSNALLDKNVSDSFIENIKMIVAKSEEKLQEFKLKKRVLEHEEVL